MQGDNQISRTLRRICAEPSRAVFWMLETLSLQLTESRCLEKLPVTAPRAPTTMGITCTFRSCQFFLISRLRSWYVRILSCSRSTILVSPGTAMSMIVASLGFFLTRSRSGLQCSITWSDCTWKSQRSLTSSFSRTFSALCSYHFLEQLKPYSLHRLQWIAADTLSCLAL